MNSTIRLLTTQDIDPLLDHLTRHRESYGAPGELLHDPISKSESWNLTARRESLLNGMIKPLSETGWTRCWGAWSAGQVLGHADLKHRGLPTNLHRAWLGMAIESQYRRQGHGKTLMQALIHWARTESSLAWIDLGVFAHNAPAIALYQALGFQEMGRTVDAFRVDGATVEDVQMTLKLHR